jgi:dihydroorotase
MEILIRGGRIMDPAGGFREESDLLIRDGIITAIGQGLARGEKVIDAAGKTVLPGFIDLHTHLREPGLESKETVLTGCRAAAAGGYTGITALPNTRPVTDDGDKVRQVVQLARQAGLVRVWPVGAATVASAGREPAALADMRRAGAAAFTDDGYGIQDADMTRTVMRLCRDLGVPFLEHCEDNSLAGGGQIHDGQVARRLGLPGIPAASETVMLARDLTLARETGCRLHVMHVSCREAVEMIRRAKAEGLHVTAEVTPHHLLLTEEAVEEYRAQAKMKPPLRTREDRDALRRGLADGTIDAVATDHAPHTAEEKSGDFTAASFGIVGLETAFSLLYTHLVETGILTLSRLVEAMSSRPAAILGVPHGALEVGAAADLVLVATGVRETIDREQFYSKGKNTPFHGWSVGAVPVLTMVEGRIVMRDGCVRGTEKDAGII